MLDNHFTTALVIGSVLALMSAVYLATALGTDHWFEYDSPAGTAHNQSEPLALTEEFERPTCDEFLCSRALASFNGSVGLWGRCITVREGSHWFKPPTPDISHRTTCIHYTLQDQFHLKFVQIGNHNSEVDYLRTYLTRAQVLLPLLSLSLMLLGTLLGVCACGCHTLRPIIGLGVLHFLAGASTLACIGCFVANMELLHIRIRGSETGPVEGGYGWSFCLACVSAPLQFMAGALFIWAGSSQRKEFSRFQTY